MLTPPPFPDSTGLEFRSFPGLPAAYCVDSDGGVWSCRPRGKAARDRFRPRWSRLKPTLNQVTGYVKVKFHPDGAEKRKCQSVHTMVAMAFLGPKPDGMECRHLDGNKLNNRVDNLQWSTHAENESDKVAHGTISRGVNRPRAKLKDRDVVEIKRRCAAGELQRLVAHDFGISRTGVSRIVLGKLWRHVA